MKLIERCKSCIILNPKFTDCYWAYAVYDENDNLLIIYFGTLKEILSMRPFRSSEKFNSEVNYKYVLLKPYETKIDAENSLKFWMDLSELQGKTPPLNVYQRVYNDFQYIQCLNNGKFYRTASDIVRIFGVTHSALSNHLRGVTGHRTVKGLRFKYHYGEAPEEVELPGGIKYKQHGPHKGYITVPSEDPINRKGITPLERKIEIERLKALGEMSWQS